MKITNLNKWKNDVVKALKCNYFVEGLKATGKAKTFCEIACENKTNHYIWTDNNEISHDCKCVALYEVYRITTHDNKKGVFIQFGLDSIEFYTDAKTHYEYKGSCRYDYSINKISYIIEFTTRLNELLEV